MSKNVYSASSDASVFIVIVLFMLVICAWIGLAFLPASIAKKKGYGFAGFLLLSLCFSFLTGLIVSLCLPNRKREMQTLLNAINNPRGPTV